ncbi:unnamed protein product [Cylindrotheca closterium]|uniref:Uncharacterized protein n=1 Tax=Cylindrotheca closterium TaxID=2856 RepID=A0AAD2CYK2_9STRA|nr:unnamed protein product [Cylindrotheca closterium]
MVFDNMDVTMNYAAPGEHKPTIERSNQTLKGLFRAHDHQMVFKAIPKVLTIALLKHVTKVSNFYPAKEGISKYYSPHMIVRQNQWIFQKNLLLKLDPLYKDMVTLPTTVNNQERLMVFNLE